MKKCFISHDLNIKIAKDSKLLYDFQCVTSHVDKKKPAVTFQYKSKLFSEFSVNIYVVFLSDV